MTSLRHYTLGETCPPSPHAVVSSLPTMADVRGYEERDPRVLDVLQSGYPRFVVHIFVRELIKFYLKQEKLGGRSAVLIPGRRAAQDLVDRVGEGVVTAKMDDAAYLVHFDADDRDLNDRVHKFVQHTGCGISSRQAEDLLWAHGLIESVHLETGFIGSAQQAVERDLAELIGCESKDVLVCASGMNAFYSGFRAVQAAQSAVGRTKWLQLGWLYLDSGCVLKEFLGGGESLDYCYDADDTEEILRRIESCGEELACVVIECPTNPLVQVADLPRIAKAVRAAGGILMIDPTVASIYNVEVLPYADILITSLTKYASFEGDVMIGAIALNSESPRYGDLILRTSSFYQPPYQRDLDRLAEQMKAAPATVQCMGSNACRLADYLKAHPAVKKVHYAGYAEHFSEVVKSSSFGGAVITIELVDGIDAFYDALETMKGPSFGTRFTLVCPFMYLAHYDLVKSKEGRIFLQSIGIDPDLIRISVGTEAIEALEKVFADALSVVAKA